MRRTLVVEDKLETVIADVIMPKMNGLELLEKIRERNLNCGVIVLSGYDLEEKKAIISHFWLDLFFGRLASSDLIREKYEWFRIAIPPKNTLVVSVISVVSDTNSSTDWAGNSKWSVIEERIRLVVNDHSLQSAAIVQSGSAEWTALFHSGLPESEFVSSLYAFGHDLVDKMKKTAGLQITIGLHEAQDPYAGLHEAFLKSRDAAQKSIADLGGVRFETRLEGTGTRREVRDALAYIRLHYSDNLTAERVANFVHVSPTYLMHLFRKELNKTFYECLTEYRIEQAKRLLRDSSYRVYEVGLKVGFGEPKYFSQIFRKMTGRSPSEYAKYFS